MSFHFIFLWKISKKTKKYYVGKYDNFVLRTKVGTDRGTELIIGSLDWHGGSQKTLEEKSTLKKRHAKKKARQKKARQKDKKARQKKARQKKGTPKR